MANNSFDRTIINPRERPLSSDIDQAQSQLDRCIRDMALRGYLARSASEQISVGAVASGCVADGFRVVNSSPSVFQLTPGIAFINNPGDEPSAINGISGLTDLSPYKPCLLTNALNLPTTPVGDAVHDRIDLIEITYSRQITNPQSRDILNTTSGQFVPGLVNKTLTFDLDGLAIDQGTGAADTPVYYKVGTPSASPVYPTVDARYIPVGAIYVPATTASWTDANAIDLRDQLAPSAQVQMSAWCTTLQSSGAITGGNMAAPPGWSVVIAAAVNSGTPHIYVFVFGPYLPRIDGHYGGGGRIGGLPIIVPSIFSDSSGLTKQMWAVETPPTLAILQGASPSIQAFITALGDTYINQSPPAAVPAFSAYGAMYWASYVPYYWNGSDWIIGFTATGAHVTRLNFQVQVPLG